MRDPRQRAADGAALARHLAATAAGLPVGHAAVYTSLPTEPPTDQAAALLRGLGWQLMLPILLPDKDLAWRSFDGDGGGGEISRDHGTDRIGLAGLVIVPALAIDRHGLRLGQGGGSYDRALARRSPGTLTIALVYDDELVDVVPSESHDLGVDAVITPRAGLLHLKY